MFWKIKSVSLRQSFSFNSNFCFVRFSLYSALFLLKHTYILSILEWVKKSWNCLNKINFGCEVTKKETHKWGRNHCCKKGDNKWSGKKTQLIGNQHWSNNYLRMNKLGVSDFQVGCIDWSDTFSSLDPILNSNPWRQFRVEKLKHLSKLKENAKCSFKWMSICTKDASWRNS